MDKFMLIIMVVLGVSFLTRIINDKANKALPTEKKAELIDLFSKNNTYTYLWLIVLIGGFFLFMKMEYLNKNTVIAFYMIALMIFVGFKVTASFRKLKKHDFPDDFIKTYTLTAILRLLSLVLTFIIVLTV